MVSHELISQWEKRFSSQSESRIWRTKVKYSSRAVGLLRHVPNVILRWKSEGIKKMFVSNDKDYWFLYQRYSNDWRFVSFPTIVFERKTSITSSLIDDFLSSVFLLMKMINIFLQSNGKIIFSFFSSSLWNDFDNFPVSDLDTSGNFLKCPSTDSEVRRNRKLSWHYQKSFAILSPENLRPKYFVTNARVH